VERYVRFAHWKWYDYFKPNRYKFYLFNLIDVFKLIIGGIQSLKILLTEKPDVVFAKGGYVSVPIGLVASWLNIPLILHDSDTRLGIANKLLARRATKLLLGMERTDSDDNPVVGIPVREAFFDLDKATSKSKLGIDSGKPLLLITGGSLGAKRINILFEEHLQDLVNGYEIVHISGVGDYDRLSKVTEKIKEGYNLHPFVSSDYPALVAAADVVVGRAGATSIAEFAAAGVASIFIPNSYLTDQVSNTNWLIAHNAGLVIEESGRTEIELMDALEKLKTESVRNGYAHKIHKLAIRDSAKKVAQYIIKGAKG
jgi:UDP-N-acetylglucosamine--N-acetylmuramyl-(pentapeptide) pyrophosphoryl-undecaprenol N-acetylglucosamine transferase